MKYIKFVCGDSMDIDFDYYRIFYYVAKTGSVTKAASVLTRNQPNVTRTIQLLETQLGCPLFIRTSRGVKLTEDGQKLYSHVRIAMEQLEYGMEELTAAQTLQSGAITIGASEVALRCFLLPVLNRFHNQYPNIKLRLLNCSAADAIQQLRNGNVDIAIARIPPDAAQDLSISYLCGIREIAVCGNAFAELTGTTVSMEQLAQCPIVSLGSQTLMYPLYQKWFASCGQTFHSEIEVATSGQILPIVAYNLGVGIVPEQYYNEITESSIHKLKLAEEIPSQSLYCMKRSVSALNAAGKRLEEMVLSERER